MADLWQGGSTHHISLTISGTEYGFMIFPDISGWRKLDISDFAPRIASGSRSYRDLSIWAVWAQEDWSHGFGFPYFTDEAGYSKTGEGVDTRHDGVMTLATAETSSETGHDVVKFVDFNSKVYACLSGDGGVREYTPGTDTWSATGQSTGTTLDALTVGDYLVVAFDGAAAAVRKFDGTDWDDVGSTTNPPYDMAHLCLHAGYIWASEEGNSYLHYAATLAGLEGGSSVDTSAISVGPGGAAIVNLISYGGLLYVAREDGLWTIDDQNTARSVMPFDTERHANNFRSMCVWRGHLYFTIRHRIYRYTGSTLLDVTPPRYEETYPYETYGDFQNLSPRGPFLYCTARNTESSYKEVLLAYDGVGWHKLWDIVDTPYAFNTINLSTTTDRLWLNYTGSSSVTSYIPLQALSDMPYESFPTSGNHYFYSSVFDAGFIDVPKTFRSLRMRTNNCSATRTIAVAYSIDDGVYSSLGTVNTSPYQELTFPDCVTYSTYGKKLQFRFNFATDDSTETPVLEAFALKYLLRPDVVWGWQLPLVLADRLPALKGRMQLEFTAEEMITVLEAARDAKCACTMTDPWGADHSVFITAVNMQAMRKRPEEDPMLVARLSLADAADC